MMNAYLRNQVAALFLFLPVTTAMVAFPTAAMAQPGVPLELRFLQVSSDAGLNSGAQLGFTAEGTPGVQAHLRIDGVSRDIPLKETSRGIYTGSYTLMRQDAVLQSSALHVTLQDGERNTVANYGFPPGMGGTPPAAKVTQPETQPPARSSGDRLKIDRFNVTPIRQIEPGAELRFSMSGPRGASASVQVPGVAERVLLRETQPGVYEGGYTIRKQDTLIHSQAIVATLSQGKRSVKSREISTWVTDTRSPIRQSMPCVPLVQKVSRSSKPPAAKSAGSKGSKASAQVAAKSTASKGAKSFSRTTAKSSTSSKSPTHAGAKSSSRVDGKSTGAKSART